MKKKMNQKNLFFYSLFLLITILSVMTLQTDAVKADEERDERRTEALLKKLREAVPPSARLDDLKIALDNYKKEDSQTLVPILEIALEHENASVRNDAAKILETLGDKASGATPALMKSLTDSDTRVQGSAKFAFMKVTGLSQTKVGELKRFLETWEEGNTGQRRSMAEQLSERYDIKVAEYAILQLATALVEGEESLSTQMAMVNSVNNIVARARGDIPQWGELFSVLSKALKDKDSVVRGEIVHLLKKMIDEKKAMDEVTQSKLKKGLDLSSLVEALKDSNELVRNDTLAILRELRKFFGKEIDDALGVHFKKQFLTNCPSGRLALAPEVEKFVQDVSDAIKQK